MVYKLNDINDAVDGKFLVTKNVKNQAEVGTLVHIMGATTNSAGNFVVDYRITSTGQDFQIEFHHIKDFSKWARPDQFIARNYEKFKKEEIVKYISAQNKTFATSTLPILIILIAAIWFCCIYFLDGALSIIIAAAATVVSIGLGIIFYKRSKSNIKMKMYKKLSSAWGINF